MGGQTRSLAGRFGRIVMLSAMPSRPRARAPVERRPEAWMRDTAAAVPFPGRRFPIFVSGSQKAAFGKHPSGDNITSPARPGLFCRFTRLISFHRSIESNLSHPATVPVVRLTALALRWPLLQNHRSSDVYSRATPRSEHSIDGTPRPGYTVVSHPTTIASG